MPTETRTFPSQGDSRRPDSRFGARDLSPGAVQPCDRSGFRFLRLAVHSPRLARTLTSDDVVLNSLNIDGIALLAINFRGVLQAAIARHRASNLHCCPGGSIENPPPSVANDVTGPKCGKASRATRPRYCDIPNFGTGKQLSIGVHVRDHKGQL